MSATTEIKNFADDPIFQVLGNTKMEPVKEEPITKELATKYSKFMANYNGSQGIPPEFRALSEKPGGNYGSIIFKKCVFTNFLIPEDVAVLIYNRPDSGPVGHIHKAFAKDSDRLFYDDIANKFSLECGHKMPYFKEDWTVGYAHNRTLSIEHSNLRMFTSVTMRNRSIHSRIDPVFKEHSAGANKSFVKPTGEAFGIEIEMSFKMEKDDPVNLIGLGNKLKFSRWVADNYPDWICERDGSLEPSDKGNAGPCGLELVSPPLAYIDHLQHLPIILEKARSLGGKGFIKGNEYYGIHITTNVYGKPMQKCADRLIYFVNHPNLRNFWTLCARRNGPALSQYCPFQDGLVLGESLKNQYAYENHYRSIHPRNSNGNAVEWRIFRSTLATQGMCAILELVKLTQDFCFDSINDLDNPGSFLAHLKSKMSSTLREWLDNFNGLEILECLSKAKNNNTSFEA